MVDNREKIKGVIIGITIIIVLITIGCDSNNKEHSKITEQEISVASTEKSEKNIEKEDIEVLNTEVQEITETEEFKKGEQVKLGDIILHINNVREQETGILLDPEPGNVYKILNIKMENTGKMSIPISTMLMFYLLDELNNKYCVSLTCGTEGGIEKTLEPGSTMEGEIAFEVNKKAEELRLVFEPGIFGQASIKL